MTPYNNYYEETVQTTIVFGHHAENRGNCRVRPRGETSTACMHACLHNYIAHVSVITYTYVRTAAVRVYLSEDTSPLHTHLLLVYA